MFLQGKKGIYLIHIIELLLWANTSAFYWDGRDTLYSHLCREYTYWWGFLLLLFHSGSNVSSVKIWNFHLFFDFQFSDDLKFSKKDEIDDLKKKLRSSKTELKVEVKKEETKDVSDG